MTILRLVLLPLLLWLGMLQPAQASDPANRVIGNIAAAALPAEGRATLALIKQGGPFPYSRDGVVFGNYEKILPQQPRGYYREYTVATPGSRNRGTRRIVSGQPGEYYYSADHYQSFKRIKE